MLVLCKITYTLLCIANLRKDFREAVPVPIFVLRIRHQTIYCIYTHVYTYRTIIRKGTYDLPNFYVVRI